MHVTLYRKYRPQRFGDLVGQEVVARALSGAIANERVAHAYLFSGIRGTGKTSAARVLARALMCDRRSEGSGEPCGECGPCVDVSEGACLDLVEIDAASNRGIDEIRDLRERVKYLPSAAREGHRAYKVYIIDEAHMLTTEAFNALLKTLEEPPAHVVFVLCTTDVEKMPATVLGRCQRYVFRPYPRSVIEAHLASVARSEGVEPDPEALALLAVAAGGSMRDAVGYLDQALGLEEGLAPAAIRQLLGLASEEFGPDLLEAVVAGDGAGALRLLSGALAGGGEVGALVGELLASARDRLVAGGAADPTYPTLVALLDDLLWLVPELRHQPDPRPLVEAMVVKLAATAALAASGGAPPAPAPPAARPALGPEAVAPTAAAPIPVPAPAAAPAAAPVAAAAEATPGPGSLDEFSPRWPEVLAAVRSRNVLVQALLLDAQPSDLEAGRVTLSFQH
ncbi:MAG: DNA polymerase III subunit gamma/tau, partial [Candidatus Dormibacteria bacterium]